MTTESNILRQILENKGEASIQLIAKQLKMGNDYARYICKELLKKGLVEKLEKKDWYKITSKEERRIGKREELLGKPTSKKHISRKKTIERNRPARLASQREAGRQKELKKKEKKMKKSARRKAIKRGARKVVTLIKKLKERQLSKIPARLAPQREAGRPKKPKKEEKKMKPKGKMKKPTKRRALKRTKGIKVKIQKKKPIKKYLKSLYQKFSQKFQFLYWPEEKKEKKFRKNKK